MDLELILLNQLEKRFLGFTADINIYIYYLFITASTIKTESKHEDMIISDVRTVST